MIGRKLFSVFQVVDLEQAMETLAADPDNQRWQAHMAHMFDIGPGVREGTTVYLEEVFHVD
jgi:L-rhamnose mutarotase